MRFQDPASEAMGRECAHVCCLFGGTGKRGDNTETVVKSPLGQTVSRIPPRLPRSPGRPGPTVCVWPEEEALQGAAAIRKPGLHWAAVAAFTIDPIAHC